MLRHVFYTVLTVIRAFDPRGSQQTHDNLLRANGPGSLAGNCSPSHAVEQLRRIRLRQPLGQELLHLLDER
jgi:hypothetical protein